MKTILIKEQVKQAEAYSAYLLNQREQQQQKEQQQVRLLLIRQGLAEAVNYYK